MPKDEPTDRREMGIGGALDTTPEGLADRQARVMAMYLRGRVRSEHHAEYLNRYLRRYRYAIEQHASDLGPGIPELLVEGWFEQLRAEVVQREDSKHAHAVAELLTNIQRDWRNRA